MTTAAALLATAHLADGDLDRVASAGLESSRQPLARVRAGYARALASRGAHGFSAAAEVLNHLAPRLTRALVAAHLMGERRSLLEWRRAARPADRSVLQLDDGLALAYDPSEPRDEAGRWTGERKQAEVELVSQWREHLWNRAAVSKLAKQAVFGGRLERYHPGEVVVYRGRGSGSRGRDGRSWTKSRVAAERYAEGGAVESMRLTRSTPALDVNKFLRGIPSKSETDQEVFVSASRDELSPAGLWLQLDRFSEVMRQVRAAGLGKDLTRLQRGYARLAYDSMRQLGSGVDATARAVVASLVADGESGPRAAKVLMATLDKLGVSPEEPWRLETVLRTQAAAAYQAGRWAGVVERWDDVWGFRYAQLDRPSKRLNHVPLDGTTLPKDHPFWQSWWPPNGWNCACQVSTVYRTPGVKPRQVPPGRLDGRVPPPDEGFGQNPGVALGLALGKAPRGLLAPQVTKLSRGLALDHGAHDVSGEARDAAGKWAALPGIGAGSATKPAAGKTVEQVAKEYGQKLKGTALTSHNLLAGAIANHDPPPGKVLVDWYWAKEDQAAFAVLHPGKEAKVVELSKHIKKKYGATTKELAQSLGDPSFGLVKPGAPGPLSAAKAAAKPASQPASQPASSAADWDKVPKFGEGTPHVRQVLTDGCAVPDRMEPRPGAIKKAAEGLHATLAKAGLDTGLYGWKGSASSLRQTFVSRWDKLAAGIDEPLEGENAKRARDFDKALDLAPKYVGVMWRGISHAEPGSDYHDALTTVGTTVTFKAPACCSRRPKESFRRAVGKGEAVYRIASRTSADIGETAGFHSEAEVVARAGTTYRVTGYAQGVRLTGHSHAGRTVIDLEEVGIAAPGEYAPGGGRVLALARSLELSHARSRDDRFVEDPEDGGTEVRRSATDLLGGRRGRPGRVR